jgi:hypothetical protein
MKHTYVLCLSLLALCLPILALAAGSPYYEGLVNKEFKRNIQLTSQLARHEYTINVANEGKEAQNLYYLALPEALASKLALITVTDEKGNPLKYSVEEKKQEIQTPQGEIADRYVCSTPRCSHAPNTLIAHANM